MGWSAIYRMWGVCFSPSAAPLMWRLGVPEITIRSYFLIKTKSDSFYFYSVLHSLRGRFMDFSGGAIHTTIPLMYSSCDGNSAIYL